MKTLFTLLALVALKMAAFATVDFGTPTASTPYERYMAPVRTVMSALPASKPTMAQVKQLMQEGRAFRYHMDDPYTPAAPATTARIHEGDCKDKALWLINHLDSSARFVIGKTSRGAKISHAWVLWQNEGRWWILDCTLKSAPIPADTMPSDRYVALYSYGKGTCYRHGEMASRLASVAGKTPVASQAQK